jgi:type III secretion protein V
MLQEISLANSESDSFAMLRDGMFYELGMLYPSFHFVTADRLKPNAFAFKVNDLTLPPRIGLASEQCIIGEDLWSFEVLGQVTVSPAHARRFPIIAVQHWEEIEAAGHVSWDQLGYLLLCLAADLRQSGQCFVDIGFVYRQFDWLDMLFPALIETVMEKFSIEQLSRALRLLAAEEVSVRNLRVILEAMLDLDYVVADPAEYILFDRRLAVRSDPGEDWRRDAQQMASMARTALRRYLSSKYGWSMEIFLVDPEIEQMLRETEALSQDAEFEARLLRAVRYQLGTRAVGSGFPPVLTSEDVRPALRRIIAVEFPLMPVLSWRDLAPETGLEPVARISF